MWHGNEQGPETATIRLREIWREEIDIAHDHVDRKVSRRPMRQESTDGWKATPTRFDWWAIRYAKINREYPFAIFTLASTSIDRSRDTRTIRRVSALRKAARPFGAETRWSLPFAAVAKRDRQPERHRKRERERERERSGDILLRRTQATCDLYIEMYFNLTINNENLFPGRKPCFSFILTPLLFPLLPVRSLLVPRSVGFSAKIAATSSSPRVVVSFVSTRLDASFPAEFSSSSFLHSSSLDAKLGCNISTIARVHGRR